MDDRPAISRNLAFQIRDACNASVRPLRNADRKGFRSQARLPPTGKRPLTGDHVTIIRHPSGGPKQIALNENRVTTIYGNYLQYTTDTERGSSGSPVFNDNWEVVGIHHAGGDLRINKSGGKRFINQAILIDKILKL